MTTSDSSPSERDGRGPTGGKWTIWNRIACFFKGHVEPPEPTAKSSVFNVYLCCRCNDVAYVRERSTGIRYADAQQYFEERFQ